MLCCLDALCETVLNVVTWVNGVRRRRQAALLCLWCYIQSNRQMTTLMRTPIHDVMASCVDHQLETSFIIQQRHPSSKQTKLQQSRHHTQARTDEHAAQNSQLEAGSPPLNEGTKAIPCKTHDNKENRAGRCVSNE